MLTEAPTPNVKSPDKESTLIAEMVAKAILKVAITDLAEFIETRQTFPAWMVSQPDQTMVGDVLPDNGVAVRSTSDNIT